MSNLAVVQMSDIEQVLIGGDLLKLNQEQRLRLVQKMCQDFGLNILARPFDYLTLNGKLVLYANKGCAEQLRINRNVSIRIVAREKVEDTYIVTVNAKLPDGREDESIGAISIGPLKGVDLANAIMKCETKAKRRATLSICGLNMPDESEVDSIPGAKPENFQHEAPPQLKQSDPATVAKDDTTPLTRTRVQIGADIMVVAKEINLGQKDLVEWVQEEFKKPLKELTIEEMSKFLGMLQVELGRKGA